MSAYRITAHRSEYVIVEADSADDAYALAESELWDLMDGPWHETDMFLESEYHE